MYDVIIIGCGVVGAACAYSLSKYDLKVAILERSNDVANGTSKANSAIIHAGYDPLPGTLMAKLNVRGAAMAEDICNKLDVPYKKCGSFVLAFDEEDVKHIKSLCARGEENEVPGICILSADEALAMEPQLSNEVKGALYAPSAGIICPWEYALAMAETAVRNGTELHLETCVTGIEYSEGIYSLTTEKGKFKSRYVIDAAGLSAGEIHSMLEEPGYAVIPTRGQYYLLDKSEGGRVSHVIFQCPNEKGKGVLVSPTVHGNLIVGPDAEPVNGNDTSVTAKALEMIADAARRSVPGVDFRQSIRNFAGVRANTKKDDFIIEESRRFPGFIYLAGIKSPGLTAAPAIGEYAAGMLLRSGLRLSPKPEHIDSRKRIRFKELSDSEKNELISRDSSYGRVICRCETITEGEIRAALRSPIPPVSINGVKRRCGAGMGRCQGGFCSPRVHELISRELNIPFAEVCLEERGSRILAGKLDRSEEVLQ